MLFTLQRYEFFSKSQHVFDDNEKGDRCCLPYKGTNFSANHNASKANKFDLSDVVYPTKVRIFQQITTLSNFICLMRLMLFTLQRYEFFSKSQLRCKSCPKLSGCCLPYKGTNFSANHNEYAQTYLLFEMLFTLQRYEFFSKSQRGRS